MGPKATFIHDFVAVDQPLTHVLAALRTVLNEDQARAIVEHAWATESSALSAEVDASPITRANTTEVDVVLGAPRVRPGATIIPVAWSSLGTDNGCPALDADLEFASFGAQRTHLHLYGRSPVTAASGTAAASMTGRIAVAVVRRFLTDLAHLIVTTGEHVATPIESLASIRPTRP